MWQPSCAPETRVLVGNQSSVRSSPAYEPGMGKFVPVGPTPPSKGGVAPVSAPMEKETSDQSDADADRQARERPLGNAVAERIHGMRGFLLHTACSFAHTFLYGFLYGFCRSSDLLSNPLGSGVAA